MAFNLDKSGEEKKKFDLSKSSGTSSEKGKSDNSSQSSSEGKKKSSSWIFALIGVVVLAIGIWYFTKQSESGNSVSETSEQTNPNNETQSSPTVQSETSNSGADNNIKPTENTNAPTNSTSSSGPDNSLQKTANNNTPNSTSSQIDANSTSESGTSLKSNFGQSQTGAITKSSKDKVKGNDGSNAININNSSAQKAIKSNNLNVTGNDLNNIVPANFNSGSSVFSSVHENIVKSILDYLNLNSTSIITINGYSSSEGDLSFNQWLSQKRADVFKKYLVGKGVSSDRIVAIGKGIENPISTNDTEDGRKQNRRIEISVK